MEIMWEVIDIGFSDDFEWLEHAKTRIYREV